MKYVRYNTATGLILGSGECPIEMFQSTQAPGTSLLEAEGNSSQHYILNGVVTPYTPAEILAKNSISTPGFTWKMPERLVLDTRTLDIKRTQAWERIKTARSKYEGAGFPFRTLRYDSDPKSIQRISGAVTMALIAQSAAQPFSIDWTSKDNTIVTLDAPGMIGLGVACGQYVDAIFDQARVFREQVDVSTDPDSITWT